MEGLGVLRAQHTPAAGAAIDLGGRATSWAALGFGGLCCHCAVSFDLTKSDIAATIRCIEHVGVSIKKDVAWSIPRDNPARSQHSGSILHQNRTNLNLRYAVDDGLPQIRGRRQVHPLGVHPLESVITCLGFLADLVVTRHALQSQSLSPQVPNPLQNPAIPRSHDDCVA